MNPPTKKPKEYPPPLQRGMSLNIDAAVIFAYALGNPLARAAVDSWKPDMPIRYVSETEFEELSKLGWR